MGIATIMQGLLASGHYTHQLKYGGGEPDEPRVRQWRYGEGWEEAGFRRGLRAHALDDAMTLWADLKHYVAQEINDE